jgi:hypothetical protein
MMQFRVIKQAIIDTLIAGEVGKYKTYASQKQTKGASENLEIPRVVCFYESGDFPKSGGRSQTNRKHNASYRIEITVILQPEVDLSVLNNPASTPAQMQAALAAMPILSDEADARLDEAFDDVYQVIQAANVYDFGLNVGDAVDSWITQMQKGDPTPRGEFFIITGHMRLEVSMDEEITGDTGTPGVAYDNTINVDGDQGDNLGASGDLGG